VLGAGTGSLAAALAGCGYSERAPNPSISLRERAGRRNLTYGSEVTAGDLQRDDAFAALIRRQCSAITPGMEFKWGFFQPRPEMLVTGPADWLIDWARRSGLEVRGHPLIWHRNVPVWAPQALGDDGWRVFSERIESVLSRYGATVLEWDVVNEAVEPKHRRADGLRESLFLDRLGPEYVAKAFILAHQAAPQAKLFYNDYGVEFSTEAAEARRAATLRLLERLKSAGAPVHGLGLQGHLFTHVPIDRKAFRNYLREVAGLGLAIRITELDVFDRIPAFIGDRDGRTASAVSNFLEVALDEPAVCGVTTWGLSDRYTDLRRRDPASRPLPYDEELRPKPMWEAVALAFDGARPRAPWPISAAARNAS